MKLAEAATPAVVLVCHRQAGIGIMRSLGSLGVPVYGIDSYRGAPAFFSKYCRGKFVWDLHQAPADQSLAFLADVARKIGRPSILIPTSDIGAMFVADHAERLAGSFIFPRQDAALMRALCSKKGMYHLVRKWNLPTPETAFPRSRADVMEYLQTARFPILLKPIYNRAEDKRWRMMKVNSERELLEQYDRVEDPAAPNAMLQEYIPGGEDMTWTFNGYFGRDSDCLLAFSGRKLRNFPPYFGQASLAVCMHNDYVEKTTIDFMRAIGYSGALDLGYRYDARDGKYKVNDINPRLGAMFRVFVGHNAIDTIRALYQDLTGQPVTPSPAREGRKWIVDDVDIISCLRYFRDGKLTIRQWLDSHQGVEERAFFSRDDPWPLAAAYVMDIRQIMRGIFGRSRRLHTSTNFATPKSLTRLSQADRDAHPRERQAQTSRRRGAAN